jgi:hypothetical protein
MRQYLLIAMLLFPLCGLARQDCLVLHRGDTICGKRYIGMLDKRRIICFETDTGKINIPAQDVREVYWKNREYWVYEDPCEGGWEIYHVIIEGPVSYLYLRGNYNGYCEDMIVIDRALYPIRKYHFSDEIWGMLSACPAFEAQYGAYYSRHKHKQGWMRWRKKVYKWMEMVRYYNQHCGGAPSGR